MVDDDDDDPISYANRRHDERVRGATPLVLTVRGKERSALLHDLSATGAKFLTRARLDVGATIGVQIYFDLAQPAFLRDAEVVRFEKWPDGAYWSFAAAVRFTKPIEGHEDAIRKLNERQASHGLL